MSILVKTISRGVLRCHHTKLKYSQLYEFFLHKISPWFILGCTSAMSTSKLFLFGGTGEKDFKSIEKNSLGYESYKFNNIIKINK